MKEMSNDSKNEDLLVISLSIEDRLFLNDDNSKTSLFSGKNKYIKFKNSLNKNFLPFNLKSKKT